MTGVQTCALPICFPVTISRFFATPSAFTCTGYNLPGHTFSRSYGVNLPSSFTRVLSSALEFSSYPPVSVCGTVPMQLKLSGFSWKHGISNFVPEGTRHHASALTLRICLENLPTRLNQDVQHLACLTFSVPTSHCIEVQEY